MNKTYRSIWNESTGTWVAAQENARGRGKNTKRSARKLSSAVGVSGAFTFVGIGLFALSPTAMAGSIMNCGNGQNSYASFSIDDGSWANANTPPYYAFPTDCTSAGSGVVISEDPNFYSPSGSYATILVGQTGASGSAPGTIALYGPNGINMMNQVSMTGNKIVNLAAGTVSSASKDAINGSQLYALSSSTAAALGGGSSVLSTGAVTAPSYALTNANSIDGTSGAKTDIGTAMTTIDTALGKLNTSITNINNGAGIKYFHANSTLADSVATGTDAVAIGGNASATTANSVALGSNSVANSATLGTAGFMPVGGTAIAAATAAGEVSVGKAGAERRITNVAAGLNPTDAVNVSQLMSEDAKVNNIGNNLANLSNTVNNISGGSGTTKYFHANSTQVDSNASGGEAIAIGGAASAAGMNSVALGLSSVSAGNVSVAVGAGASTAGAFGVAIGAGAKALTTQSDAIGDSTTASGLYAVAVGTQSKASGQSALAVGDTALASGNSSTAIGQNANASTSNSVALGSNSVANSATLATAGFTPVGGTAIAAATAAGGEVSVGAAGAERRITNVAAGLNPTDAVNVSQLTSEDAKVNNVSNNVSNVANNLSNLGNNVTNINNQVTNIVNGGGIKYFHANSTLADSSATGANSVAAGPAAVASASNAVAMGNGASATTANSVALGSNSVANSATLGTAGFQPVGGTAIAAATAAGGEVSVGAAGAERRITNVAAGLNPTDAVNVSQLMSEDAKVNNVSNNVSNVANNLSNLGNNV
ncbi:hypothetical protein G3N95_40080, partial [Paraburkholderia sp. Tr-20389]|nr:hypothetical protein [Paraburkholderia sp. Tr-20389]